MSTADTLRSVSVHALFGAAGCAGLCAALLSGTVPAVAQEPAGLAASALNHPDFTWIAQRSPSFRVYFLAGSYPAGHRDRLVGLVESARDRALHLLGVKHFDHPIDVFFIESRAQMDSLVGAPVTGFADRNGRAVFLVTNEEWRPFEQHEVMHVIAYHVWGQPAQPSGWIEEGLAQFADGRCGSYPVDRVARSLIVANGVVPFDTLVQRFRQLDDLTAYLEAASLIGYLYTVHGREAVRWTWSRGPAGLSASTGQTSADFMDAWLRWLEETAATIPADSLDTIRRKGCG